MKPTRPLTRRLRHLVPLLALGGPLVARAAPEPTGPEVRLTLPELGRTVRRQKTWDAERGVGGTTNRDERGGALTDDEVDRLQAEEARTRHERFGALDPGFAAEFLAARPDELLPVLAVAPLADAALPSRPGLDDERRSSLERIHARRADHRRAVGRAADGPRLALEAAVVDLGGRIDERGSGGPFVIAALPAAQILELARRPEAASIYRGGQVLIEDLINSTCAMGADAVQALNVTGNGVNVAVVEPSEVDGNLSCINLVGSQNNSGVANHPTWVAGVIASTLAAQTGVAPGANLFSGATNGGSMASMIDWALVQGVDVVNMSFTSTQTGTIQGDDVQVDFYVRNMATTIAKSAGNIGSAANPGSCFQTNNVTSPGIGFNAITVGNMTDGNACLPANFSISAGSCFLNPQSPHGDREKPEVVAPGIGIVTINSGAANSCNTSAPVNGTSFSTPHVAGAAALLIERLPVLAFWPETIKALLMATAWYDVDNVVGLSDRDGAGGIDVSGADEALTQGRFTGEPWKKSTFDADGRHIVADFFVPAETQRLKVALVWSTYGDTGQTAPTNDIDLFVERYDTVVGSSARFDNSYEVVDLTNPEPGPYRIVAQLVSGTLKKDKDAQEYGAVAWGLVNPCLDFGGDPDGDGLCSDVDNCDHTNNLDQADQDGDSVGDACDNCVEIKNTNQANQDGDALGDACDGDQDGDGCDNDDDNDPTSATQIVGHWFSFSCNPAQGTSYGDAGADSDHDGLLDCALKETDNDHDGLPDDQDTCPTVYDPENGGLGCSEFVDCPVTVWWDVCLVGNCNDFLIDLVSAINPDPTVYERFAIDGRTLVLALPADTTPLAAAEAFLGAEHGVLKITDQRGRLISIIAAFDARNLELGDLSRGNALRITPLGEGRGLQIEAGEVAFR